MTKLHKAKAFPFLLALLFVSISNSQDYSFETPGDIVMNINANSASEITSYITLKNDSNQDIELFGQRDIIQLAPNTEHGFCWYSCYPNSNFTPPPQSVIIVPGGSFTMQSKYYKDNDNTGLQDGTSIVSHQFWTTGNEVITVKITYIHNTGSSQLSVEENDIFSKIKVYPNPVSNGILHLKDIPKDFNIDLYNLFGHKVYSSKSKVNNMQINVKNLPSGMYLLRASNGTKSFSKKVMI